MPRIHELIYELLLEIIRIFTILLKRLVFIRHF
jgi:hypothetical protein